jgi:glycosyltransferase involved in cell wall biosynthesis
MTITRHHAPTLADDPVRQPGPLKIVASHDSDRPPASEPFHIAIIGSRGFPSTYGGYETLVRHIAPLWVRDGHRVTVYCRDRPAATPRWSVDGVECIWTPGHDSKSASTLSFGFTSHIHAALQRYDAALVLNIANGFFLPFLAARSVPTILNTDGLEWERGKWNPAARRVFYRGAVMSAKYADVLVSDSRAIASIWEEQFGVTPRFIPYGGVVRTAVPHDRLPELGLTKRSYALVVARLIPENNVDLTLDALDHLPRRPPAVVAGSANYATPLQSRLRELHSRGQVLWLGHVHDQELLAQLWAHCGVYIHGHSVGGTNPALLQALGAGAPTLALDTPFNREVLCRPDQLFPRDPAYLAGGIAELLSNHSLQSVFAAHGRQRVSDAYRWETVADDYLAALLAARGARQRISPEPT